MRTCPMCSNEAADDATACICGYTFQAKAAGETDAPSLPRAKPAIMSWGGGLLALGILGAVGSQFMNTTVASYPSYASEGVHNIGLMQQQLMVFQAGLAASLGGIICLAVGLILERFDRA